MQSKKNSVIKKTPSSILVYAYGFDKIGFKWERFEPFKVGGKAEIKFVRYEDNSCRLDTAQGVIIPSGIFDTTKEIFSSSDLKTFYKPMIDSNKLLQRKHDVENILQLGGWVLFLVRDIIARNIWINQLIVKEKHISIQPENYDLCNLFLSRFNIVPDAISISEAKCDIKDDEFRKYIDNWGAAQTILKLQSKGNQEQKILAEASGNVVGVEFQSKAFFLPFHTLNCTEEELIKITKQATSAVCDYVQRRRVEVPEWTNQFKFENESKAEKKLKQVLSESKKLQEEMSIWNGYKGVLVQSGDILKNTIVGILRNFFGLKVKDVEELMEDATIENEKNEPIVFVEIKGTKSGIKRQHINQIDTNREARGYDQSFSGLLIINNQIDVIGIKERLKTTVAKDVIRHAKANNVLILRTVDLLFLMRRFEGKSNEHRGKKFLEYCMQGGGRLKIENNSIKIIDGTNS